MSEADAAEHSVHVPRTAAGRWLDKALAVVLMADMLAMLALTFVDVIGRYVFNSPVPGSFEIVSIMLGVSIAAGMPLVTSRREHIAVNLFEASINRAPKLRRAQDVTVALLSLATVIFMTYRMWFEALNLEEGRTQTGFLELPLAPVAYLITLMFAVTGLILLGHLVDAVRGRPR